MLGLTLLRKMGLFHKHRLMIIETIDIHQEQKNLARYDSKVMDKCTNEKSSKSECQDEDSVEVEVVDVTCSLIFRGPTIYIQRVISSQDPQLTVESS